MSQITSCR